MANEIEKRNEAFLIYQDENGIARVNVRFEGEDVWLTVEQIMELFDASQQDVSYHIKQIYADGEQDAERTHKKILLVRQEGNRSVRIMKIRKILFVSFLRIILSDSVGTRTQDPQLRRLLLYPAELRNRP